MLHSENAVSETLEHGENISYHRVKDKYFMQKRTELMETGNAILESFADRIHSSRNMLESAGSPAM